MPLIIFVGPPSCGKSSWSRRLVSLLQERIDSAESDSEVKMFKILCYTDELLGISHQEYSTSLAEKNARAKQLSVVKRHLSRTNIVILDSLNYIKGFRYQLYCEAKGLGTTHCVIQTMASLETCLEWNQSNPTPWDPKVINELSMRYEEPNGVLRWDSPLFNLVSDDIEETIPINEVWNALVMKQPPPPNSATVIRDQVGTDFLQELDRETQLVLTAIGQHQNIYSIGGRVSINAAQNLYIDMPSVPVSASSLQRARRAYIALNRMRNIDKDRITPLFVDYLNSSLNCK